MAATKRIPISPEIWEELSRLKKQGQTFDDLIEKMVENQKKLGLLKDMQRIEETAEFVDIMTIEEAHKRYGRL
jgi:predicted CopG family antitoxin